MIADCPLCLRPQTHRTIASRDRHGEPLHTVFCLSCGIARTHPLPTAEELSAFYTEQYRRLYKSLNEPACHHVLRAGNLARARLGLLRDQIRPGVRVLDCGSGGGEFLYLARRMGCQVQGIEPNNGYANFARRHLGLEIECGMLENVNLPEQGFDVVTLFHVLEHVGSPVDYLARIAQTLVPDSGVLLVEVPNLTCTASHPRSRYHRAHLFHFTESTLRFAGERAGLRAIRSGHTQDIANVWTLFHKPSDHATPAPAHPANAGEVLRILESESALTYYASVATWLRTLNRLMRQLGERVRARNGREKPSALLDALPLD